MKKKITRMAGFLLALMVVTMTVPLQANAVQIINGPSIMVYITPIYYGGHQWVVIGDETSGVGNISGSLDVGSGTGQSDTATLLHSNGCCSVFGTNVVFNSSGISDYAGGELHAAMTGISFTDPEEQKWVIPRTLNQIASDGYGTATAILAGQNFWPLSIDEYFNVAANNLDARKYGSNYWLRSPASTLDAYFVSSIGGRSYLGAKNEFSVRPAFILNLSDVVYTSGAATGKPTTASPELFPVTPPAEGEPVKLTYVDPDIQLVGVKYDAANPVSDRTLYLDFSGDTQYDKTFNTVVGIVFNNTGEMVSYGLLANTTGSGTFKLTIPDEYDLNTQQIYIALEQQNDEFHSDFTSGLVPISFDTQALPDVTPRAATNEDNNDGQIGETTAAMEYSTDGGNTWATCPDGAITGLTPGDYLVRYASYMNGAQPVIASLPTTVTIGAYVAPATPEPVQDPGPGSPQTGDAGNSALWVALGTLAGLCIVVGMLVLKKKSLSK